jgi:hypothetical protein
MPVHAQDRISELLAWPEASKESPRVRRALAIATIGGKEEPVEIEFAEPVEAPALSRGSVRQIRTSDAGVGPNTGVDGPLPCGVGREAGRVIINRDWLAAAS